MNMKQIKYPYYSELYKMWAVEFMSPDGEFRGHNIDWCATEAEALGVFKRYVNEYGYEVVGLPVMTAAEISEIKDGDSIIINGIDTVFQGGVFHSSDMELRVMDAGNKIELADYHLSNSNWQKFYTLRLNRLVMDAESHEKYGFKRQYSVHRGGKMTLAEKSRIGRINDEIYGNS